MNYYAWAKGCLSKRRYETAREARDVKYRSEKKRPDPLRVYHCEYCGGWHLTSSNPYKDH